MLKIYSLIKKFFYLKILHRKYYRTGQCNRCGLCCQNIYVRHRNTVVAEEEEFKSLQAIHPFYTYIEIVDKDEFGLVFRCTKFDKENKVCTIHKKRPGICQRYPSEAIFSMGAMLSDNCGYGFNAIEPFEEILQKMQNKSQNS